MARSLFIADLAVASPDLVDGGRMPDVFTAYHEDVMPTIVISEAPAAAVELALICHDPDAPLPRGFTHLVVYGILPERMVAIGPDALAGLRVGPNGTGAAEWMGPRPPAGHGTHRYYFWAYALARPVEGAPTREEFLDTYADDIIEQNRMVVTYDRAAETDGPHADRS